MIWAHASCAMATQVYGIGSIGRHLIASTVLTMLKELDSENCIDEAAGKWWQCATNLSSRF